MMIERSNLKDKWAPLEIHYPSLKAVLWAPFSMPFVGLFYSLLQPMPEKPISNLIEVFEYLGLFAMGGLVLGFPLGLAYGYPVLRFTSKRWSDKKSRMTATLALSLVPSLLIFAWLQEMNYFTKACMAMSVTTAMFAQLLLFRLEAIESR